MNTTSYVIENRAFVSVYKAAFTGNGFEKDKLYGRVNHLVWTPEDESPIDKIITGKMFPFEEKVFEGKQFIKLRDKIVAPQTKARPWNREGPKKPKAFRIGPKSRV